MLLRCMAYPSSANVIYEVGFMLMKCMICHRYLQQSQNFSFGGQD